MYKLIAFLCFVSMALMLVAATITTLCGGYWLGCTLTLGDIFAHPIAFFLCGIIFGIIAFFL